MTTATDNFTGADGTQLPTYNANWTTTGNASAGSFVLLDNGVTSPLSGSTITLFNSYTGTFANHQSSSLLIKTIGAGGQFCGVAVRVTSGNCYYLLHDSGGWIVGKTVASVLTGLASGSRTCSPGDIITLDINSTTLLAQANGSTLTSLTDSDVTSGNPGLASLSLSASAPQIVGDNWIGTDEFGCGPLLADQRNRLVI